MLTETSIGVIATTANGKGVIFLKEPMTCKVCNREVMILINEAGSTRCTTCPEPT